MYIIRPIANINKTKRYICSVTQ